MPLFKRECEVDIIHKIMGNCEKNRIKLANNDKLSKDLSQLSTEKLCIPDLYLAKNNGKYLLENSYR